ncbi:MAG TPA: radical SAM protein [Candidatus Cloacimonadota bacterium]|nr:radical SAM protein [Candidatus Cloacimonadota bacterium]HPY97172.1 radical SAM protein [Candidatus Cloacimonadota bacterium]HQB40465.1 radical SAM protein [Candidatus Cloacimonadota bacterium]
MKYQHLFGPVLSRRLGLSLGVDLVPYKVCSYDCVYCEAGSTNNLTNVRSEYVNTEDILTELDHYLPSQPKLDYITFSGAGEPTLHKDIAKIAKHIKEKYPQYPLALITNSSLVFDDQMREDMKDVDLLLPSLDAVSEEVFKKINRPYNALKASEIVEGLVKFKQSFKGQMHLEIFIIEGVNDTESELKLLKEACTRIQPDKIQINTLDRPGTEEWVVASSRENLERIKEYFKPLPAEIIAKIKVTKEAPAQIHTELEDIVNLIKRRPCTQDEIIRVMNLHINTVSKYLRFLIENSYILEKKEKRGIFYQIKNLEEDE